MRRILFALSLMIAVPTSADTFEIPAEYFDVHTWPNDMSGVTEDDEGINVRELRVNGQLNIQYWRDAQLQNYSTNLKNNGTPFEVCATVANLNNGQTNRIRINHPNPDFNKGHNIDSNRYETFCSKQGEFGDVRVSAGVKVLSSSQGPVEVRAVFFRPIQENALGPLTTETSSSWELDLFRSETRTLSVKNKLTYETNEQARAVLTIGDVVYVGGDFKNIKNGGVFANPAQSYIAAFDRNTGDPIPDFDIELDGPVYTLASNNDTLYIGGAFNTANRQNRKYFAAYEIANGNATLTNFRLKTNGTNISPNRSLRDIAITGDKLYLAGFFTKVGGNDEYAYVAAFDLDSGEIVENFKPNPNRAVKELVAGGDEGLWMGGDFKQVNGISHENLALVDHNTGELKATSPSVPYPVIDLAATSTQLFVAGGGTNPPIIIDKETIKAVFKGNIAAAFDRNTQRIQWELQGDGNVQGVDVDGGRYVYFGGHYEAFEYIRNSNTNQDGEKITGGAKVDRLSRHDKTTGEIDFTWLPFVDGIRSINGIDVTSDGLYIVGDFFQVGGDTTNPNNTNKKNHRGFAIFNGATN